MSGLRRAETATAWDRAWRGHAERWQAMSHILARATGWKVWNPGLYGATWHSRFRRRYRPVRHPLIFFGLNPGPYGMAQTGIPFTDLRRLTSALPGLAGELRDAGEGLEIPGLAPRSLRPYLSRTFESSCVRVYRFLEKGWGNAERGWRELVVVNPCPLLFVDPGTGRNRTPADLGQAVAVRTRGRSGTGDLVAETDRLRRLCAAEALEILRPRGAVLLGRNVEASLGPLVLRILGEQSVLAWEHPARAVPEEWAAGLLAALVRRGLVPIRHASSERR